MEGILQELKHCGNEDDRIREALLNEKNYIKHLNHDIHAETMKAITAINFADTELRKKGDVSVVIAKIKNLRRIFFKIHRVAKNLARNDHMVEAMTELAEYAGIVTTNLDKLTAYLQNPNRNETNAHSMITWMREVFLISEAKVSKDINKRYAFIERVREVSQRAA